MNPIKSTWINYFSANRTTRRTDMRHYLILMRATFLSIFIVEGLLVVNNDFCDWRVITFATLLLSILFVSILYFKREYSTAERQMKQYTDAIDLIFNSKPLSNEEYHKLFYLAITDNYEMQTQLGKFLTKQVYLKSGFPWLGASSTKKYLKKYGNDVPLIRDCFYNPKSIWDSLNFVPEDESREIPDRNETDV